MPRARPSAKSPVGRTKSRALLALAGAFLYLLVAIVSASAALIVLDPSRPRFRPARILLGILFALLAFAVLARLHYVSSRDFSLIAIVAFLTGLVVDALAEGIEKAARVFKVSS